MAEETQRIIERYLELVQPERKEEVDQAELEAIARELGVTEDEIRAGEAAASDHATRGRLHSAHGLHDDAVRELGAALALRPFDPEIRRGLAEVLVARFEANNEPQDASLARSLALQVIDTSPDDKEAYALLERLERARRQESPLGSWRALLVGLVLVFGAGIAIFAWIAEAPPPSPEVKVHVPKGPPPVSPKATQPSNTLGDSASGEVSVAFEARGKLKGFTFEATRSRFERYATGALSYKLHAELSNTSAYALTLLTLKFDLIGDDGSVLHTSIKKVLRPDEPVHRPGDVLAWSHLFFDKEAGASGPLPKTLKVTLSDVVTEPKVDYPESRPLPVSWLIDQGAFKLQVRQRSFRANDSPLLFGPDKGKFYSELVLEVENTGQAMRQLKVRATWLDDGGASLGATERFVIGPIDAPLPQGRSRLYRLVGTAEAQPARATLELIGVK